MHKIGRYGEGDSMSGLICEHYPVLLVLSRYGIPLGFGDKSIGEVCRDNGVDTGTFLAVVNLLLDEGGADMRDAVSVESLLTYLGNSHSYFLDFRLPGIRNDLLDVVGNSDSLSKAIINYFDEYVAEVRQHMTYEEEVVFPYVRSLLGGGSPGDYKINIFSKRHDQVEARLTEFKNILIKYFPARSTNEINAILFDIFSCERDLASHNAVEDVLFVPAIERLENKGGRKK